MDSAKKRQLLFLEQSDCLEKWHEAGQTQNCFGPTCPVGMSSSTEHTKAKTHAMERQFIISVLSFK